MFCSIGRCEMRNRGLYIPKQPIKKQKKYRVFYYQDSLYPIGVKTGIHTGFI